MTDQPRQAAEYALGYSEREKERLIIQSRLYGELTERLFRMAGIQPGMSVLDVGCGVGDVSLLAATIVGPAGSVLGVDRAADSIDTAQGRAERRGWRTSHSRSQTCRISTRAGCLTPWSAASCSCTSQTRPPRSPTS